MHLPHDLQRQVIFLCLLFLPSETLLIMRPLAALYSVLNLLTDLHKRYMLSKLAPIEPANGKLALCTGGTSGICAKIADGLAARGFGLILVSSSAANVAARKAELLARHPSLEVRTFLQDLSQAGAASALYGQLSAIDGLLDRTAVLVNAAGKCIPPKLLAETPLEVLEGMVNLNVVNLASLSKLIVPHFLKAKRGRILNISSVAGEAPAGLGAAYHATKSFVSSFSLGLGYELEGTGVGVTVLAPGATDTGFAKRGGAERALVFNAPLTHQGPNAIAQAGLNGLLSGAASVPPPFTDFLSRAYVDLVIPYMPQRLTLFIATLFWKDVGKLPLVGGLLATPSQTTPQTTLSPYQTTTLAPTPSQTTPQTTPAPTPSQTTPQTTPALRRCQSTPTMSKTTP